MRHARELLHTPARKKRQRTRRTRLAFVALGGLLVTAGLLSWVSHMDQVRIAAIEVAGNKILEGDEIRGAAQTALAGNYLFIFPKDNTFLYPKDKVLSSLLDSFPRIKDAKINREGLTKLSLTIDERAPAGIWCGQQEGQTEGSACYFLDDESFIYAEAPLFSGTSYLAFYGALFSTSTENIIGEHFADTADFHALIELRDILSRQGVKIITYEKQKDGDYRARIEQGGTILVNLTASPKDIALAIASSLEAKKNAGQGNIEDIDYIDARFLETGKVFIKFN